MKIYNITRQNLEQALENANKFFDGNLKFGRCDEEWNQGRFHFKVLIRCHNSKKYGAMFSHSGRRINSASWFALKNYFDELYKIEPYAKIVTMLATYNDAQDYRSKFLKTRKMAGGIGERSLKKEDAL